MKLTTNHISGLKKIQNDPAAFVEGWLGSSIYSKQKEILFSVRDNRRTSVRSCNSAGKSFISARVVIWYLHAYPDSMVITTAPTMNQVTNILWREVRSAFSATRLPLLGRCLTSRYEIGTTWYAMGFKSDDASPDKFQGFHADRILLVVDEAAGVAEPVYGALDAIMTGENTRQLLIGNPTSVSGSFYESHHKMRSRYNTITISANDTPNFTGEGQGRPYLITKTWVDDVISRHGEDSPYVQSRVFANFPRVGEKTLIPLVWIEKCANQRIATVDGEVVAGLDIARYGGDENAICIRRGPKILHEEQWSGIDLMETVGKVRNILRNYPDLKRINADEIGLGGGVVDRLKELDYPVVGVNVGKASSNSQAWSNLRNELWWNLRERFREFDIIGPIGEETQAQLSSIRYKYDSRHTHPVIETKEELKKRGLKSPDRAEAMLLSFADIKKEDSWEII